jgi:hypothetical protein
MSAAPMLPRAGMETVMTTSLTITKIVHALTASLFVNCLMTISETSLGRNEPSRSGCRWHR